VWIDAGTEAFVVLKTTVMMAPVLDLPDFGQPFI
jgi:hypothetical protein